MKLLFEEIDALGREEKTRNREDNIVRPSSHKRPTVLLL